MPSKQFDYYENIFTNKIYIHNGNAYGNESLQTPNDYLSLFNGALYEVWGMLDTIFSFKYKMQNMK